MDNIGVGDEQCVHCREVVHYSECPLSEVPLYSVDFTPHMCEATNKSIFFFV